MIKGDRLKKLRKDNKLTQSEFGDLVGLKKSVVCLYERELRNPPIETIVNICEKFNVTSDYLMGIDEVSTIKTGDGYDRFIITKEEKAFLKELRSHKDLYDTLMSDVKRSVDLLNSKIN